MQKSFNIRHAEALFFDFDGVITDTIEIKTMAFGHIFKEYGKETAKKMMDYHRRHSGVSRYEKFKYFYNQFLGKQITKKEMQSLDKKLSRIVFNRVIKAPFIKGVKKFMNICYKNKKKCFIISATPAHEIKKIIRAKNLKRYFNEVLGSPENKVDNLKSLLRKYSLKSKKCFYFGDAKSDMDAAIKCRVNFVGINCLDGIKGYKDFKEFIKQEMRW